MKKEKPDFFCVGFQKSGTTTLYEIFKQHRGVVLCRDVKETMYYRVKGLRAIGGKRYYQRRYFGHVKPEDTRLCGEINAGLSYNGCAKKLCRDFSSDTKLIFMMRNPVDRAYSAYKYFLARGFLPMRVVNKDLKYGHAAAFDSYAHEILDNERHRRNIMKKRLKYLVFSQSNYAACIQEFQEHFKQIHLVFFEEFVRNEKKACEEIWRFLGLDADEAIDYSVCANEGNERAVSGWRSKHLMYIKGWKYGLKEFICMPHWAPGLYGWFERFYEKVRKKCLAPDEDKSQMLPDTRKYLEAYFAEEVEAIERISGRDLSGVWYDVRKNDIEKAS